MSVAADLYQALAGSPTLVQFQTAIGMPIVQFDAMMSETYDTQSKPTEFPVEQGSVISDHIIRSPQTMSFVGVVTDTPINLQEAVIAEAATVAATLTLPPIGIIAASVAYATWLAHAGATSRSQDAYAALLKLQIGNPWATPPTPPQPFRIVTKLGTFEDMVITSLSVPRDASTGDALIFNIAVQHIDVVMPQTIVVSVADTPALAATRASVGEQQTSEFEGIFRLGDQAGAAATQNFAGSISKVLR